MEFGIFLISLKEDNTRRDKLIFRFKNSYKNFKFIDAIDGSKLETNQYFLYALNSFKINNLFLSPAEIGCCLSHMKAYDEFINSNLDYALILEDDVIGDDESIKLAFEYVKHLDDKSVFICGCQDGLEGRFSAFGKKIQDNFYLVSKHSHSSIYRAAAYILSKDCAKQILKAHQDALYPADFWSCLLKKADLNMYFSDIFSHPIDLSDSKIQSSRVSKGYNKKNILSYFKSLRYIFLTRIEVLFKGFERIFKR
ncbi:glycosyltransferase family 25 protein [Campylobacter pinnipediorum]|uniref:Glycosyl transferase n=1 Tax=Campylobacter pinnipediorum subsp. pinnipediorum TaxID=1660067 RepID=A0AAX0LAB5_9BACT|nr:glycosyltransferase family 25 protein [Campylobacter pinnipediorum]AQW81144.1 glycosyltransferase, family 25 [Campylobacter pinnipediorum subsp. pinnipediorum]AQW82762.1 glycosyltransferase, family 25 [Campylobacter pinnipediorum subsp. pinnipediorum]AQW84449.1 glycosyltransferase, family 25 [Campylobacter pinnipediorum subsp. pinnipediorum]OPA77933.1 glycosyl transferase [Campylobacter pinnipediorum subsp. pinnipediorum]